ncbi:MAG: hypothetical protein MJZ72_06395 [Bacteroidales bacterium]|nr:hypothetical protein [Bacteroidales bacterium]
MYKSQHYKFITTPLSKILEDSVNAIRGIGSGIETYPLCDYIMQSVFLKMTGAQEQKMKCICWEMATNDYEYRYEYLNNKNYGEHSDYCSKNNIYKDLIKRIPQFDIDVITANVKDVKNIVLNILDNPNLLRAAQQESFSYFKSNNTILKDNQIKQKQKDTYILFQSDLHKSYDEIVYKHRNRCAHNLTSYQQNLPTLDTLASSDYIYHNYFFRFAILILIDEIFICLYKKYVEALENNINW